MGSLRSTATLVTIETGGTLFYRMIQATAERKIECVRMIRVPIAIWRDPLKCTLLSYMLVIIHIYIQLYTYILSDAASMV